MNKSAQLTTSTLSASVASPGRLGAALARAVDIAHEHRCSLSVIAVAIDDVAEQAARHGLSVEQLEQQVGSVLVGMLRNLDLVGRRHDGGFMIVTAPSFHFEGKEVATRLTKAIKNVTVAGLPELTLSCGVAAYRADDTATSFGERAMAALNRSLARGGGCTVSEDVDESQFSP